MIDFIGPLPIDENYNCILTMTDCLGSDVWLVPTITTLTTEDMAQLFFDNWYCKNGLPHNIVSDHNKLTGVKLKLLSSYHPETDGISK